MYGPGEKPKTNLHTQYVSKEDVLEHINQLKNYKFVIGSRYVTGGNCEMRGFRLLLSRVDSYF